MHRVAIDGERLWSGSPRRSTEARSKSEVEVSELAQKLRLDYNVLPLIRASPPLLAINASFGLMGAIGSDINYEIIEKYCCGKKKTLFRSSSHSSATQSAHIDSSNMEASYIQFITSPRNTRSYTSPLFYQSTTTTTHLQTYSIPSNYSGKQNIKKAKGHIPNHEIPKNDNSPLSPQ